MPPAPPPETKVDAAAENSDAAVFVTYVDVDRGWIAEHGPAPPALVKTWAGEPANAKLVLPATRHILIKSSAKDSAADRAAARKKATTALARLTHGEDFAKVADEVTEDPGSKGKGGAYPGAMVENFVEPYRVAYAALAPGQFTKQLVESNFGFHIIKKDAVDDAALATAYRRAMAEKAALAFATELASRLRPAHSEASATRLLSELVASQLGSEAAADDSRPDVRLVALAKVPPPPQGDVCAKLIGIPSGSVVVMPLPQERGFLVAKASTEAADADEAARAVSASEKTADGTFGYCRPGSNTTLPPPAPVRKQMEKAQRAQLKK